MLRFVLIELHSLATVHLAFTDLSVKMVSEFFAFTVLFHLFARKIFYAFRQ